MISWNRQALALIYDERISWQRNQSKSLPPLKTTQLLKEQWYRTTCLDCHFCFPVVFVPQQNPTTVKGCREVNTRCQNIQVHCRYPYPQCKYETEVVKDELAAVLHTVHLNGTHVQAQYTSNSYSVRSRKCSNRPYRLQNLGKSGLTSIPAGKIASKPQNSKAKTWPYNCSNFAGSSFEKTSQGMQAVPSSTNSVDKVMTAVEKKLLWERKTLFGHVQLHNMHPTQKTTGH